MGLNLPSGHVQTKLQSDQNGNFESDQLPPAHPERVFRFFDQQLELIAFDVVQFGGQYQTGARAQFTVLFVDQTAQNQFFKVNVRLRDRQQIDAAFLFHDFAHFPFQTVKKKKMSNLSGLVTVNNRPAQFA